MQRYKLKLISAADYILSLTAFIDPKGQKLNLPSAKSFYEQFGIAKSTSIGRSISRKFARTGASMGAQTAAYPSGEKN
jgi:hypothetical protein